MGTQEAKVKTKTTTGGNVTSDRNSSQHETQRKNGLLVSQQLQTVFSELPAGGAAAAGGTDFGAAGFLSSGGDALGTQDTKITTKKTLGQSRRHKQGRRGEGSRDQERFFSTWRTIVKYMLQRQWTRKAYCVICSISDIVCVYM